MFGDWLRRLFRRGLIGDRDREFVDAVTAEFRFLVARYGFRQRPPNVVAYERWVVFESAAAKVIVQQELGSGPFVTLQAPDGGGLRTAFGLHELEQELVRAGAYERKPVAPATLRESVAVLARTLETIGNDVLRGDFAVLFARAQRHVDAVRRK